MREHPVGCGVSLHVAWPGTAHIPGHQHHVAWPRSAWTHPKWSGRSASQTRSPLPVPAIHRSPGLRQRAYRVKHQRKRPGSSRIPGLCEQSVEGARSGATFSRIQRTQERIEAIASYLGPAHRRRKPRDERDRRLWGRLGSIEIARCHGSCPGVRVVARASRSVDAGAL